MTPAAMTHRHEVIGQQPEDDRFKNAQATRRQEESHHISDDAEILINVLSFSLKVYYLEQTNESGILGKLDFVNKGAWIFLHQLFIITGR